MDLCSEPVGTLCFLGLEHLFRRWFKLWVSAVLRPCNGGDSLGFRCIERVGTNQGKMLMMKVALLTL